MVAGVVLAGGRSRRMGTDKAFQQVHGIAMASHVAAVLRQAGCTPVYLAGNHPALTQLGLPVLREPERPQRHPLFGVAAALRQLRQPVLFSPCDLPRLRPDALRQLLMYGGPCVAQGQHLLCLLLPEDADEAERLAIEGRPAHALTARLPAIHLPDEVLFNANTPEDLSRMRRD